MKTIIVFRTGVLGTWREKYTGIAAFAKTVGWQLQPVDARTVRPDFKRILDFWKPHGIILDASGAPEMFKGEKFDVGAWVDLFKKAGAKYVMPVCEHHDGFAMYSSELNRWNAAEMGPCRDVAGEIRKACDERGLAFCGSSHRAEHYFFMNMGRTIECDVNDEEYRDFYGPAYLCAELSDTAVFHTLEDVFSLFL